MKKNKKTKHDPKKMILDKLSKSEGKGLSQKELMKAVRKKDISKSQFYAALDDLIISGRVTKERDKYKASQKALKTGEVVKLNRTFGFVRLDENGQDVFIPGRFLLGAMPGDIVEIKLKKSRGESPEGIVVRVKEEKFSRFTGEIVMTENGLMVSPDQVSNTPIRFENPMGIEVYEGDKVLAHITRRGESHRDHECELAANFGSSQKAAVCALSILEMNGLTPLFPNEVIYEARMANNEHSVKEGAEGRLDLRDKPIFTIDGADTKDIDDAVSVEKDGDGYLLGVHIADVSHYVKAKSVLDNEAFRRGTSVYYANRVIPMLPKELSNGICSLNPQVDRLAFSCLCRLDKNGVIRSFRFVKSVIRSRVKGVYSEINEMLDGYTSKAMAEKYKEVYDQLPLMKELADILAANVKKRGAPQLETTESKL
ncbi:MAG: RNB domain-containing ribonuclease, partial [Ruminococcus sp.]|nr:RNB domain-containing ribonuclease [Ruminococcus sp.]